MAKDFDAVEVNLLSSSSFIISQFRYYAHQSKLANASSATNTMIKYSSSSSQLSLHLPVLHVIHSTALACWLLPTVLCPRIRSSNKGMGTTTGSNEPNGVTVTGLHGATGTPGHGYWNTRPVAGCKEAGDDTWSQTGCRGWYSLA